MPVQRPVDLKKEVNFSSLKDRNVLLTGGASGLGKSQVPLSPSTGDLMAHMYARHGANLVIGDINENQGADVEKELSTSSAKVKFIHLDVSSFASQVAFLRTALAFFPRNEVDIFVPCAGLLSLPTQVSPADPADLANLTHPTPDLTGRLINVNLTGVYIGTLLVTRYGMGLHANPQPTPAKSVVLIASLAGYCGAEGSIEYTTTKFGVRGLLRGFRKQLATLNVRLNAVAPFYVDTPMTAHVTPVLGQLGVPLSTSEHVVEAVARLSTDEEAWGRSIFVMPEGLSDGGDDDAGGQGGKSFSVEAFGEAYTMLVSGPMSDNIQA